MQSKTIGVVVLGAIVFTSQIVSAQVISERNISMKMAQTITDAAMEKCLQDGHKVVVVVVDRAGQMAAMLRADGTNPHNFELARRKAYTSRTFRQTTTEFFKRTEVQPSAGLRVLTDVIWTGGGGAPIKAGNETIGGIGVSGAPGGTGDDVCARAALDKVADQLK